MEYSTDTTPLDSPRSSQEVLITRRPTSLEIVDRALNTTNGSSSGIVQEALDQPPQAQICIYKFPDWLREGTEKNAFIPQVVSIGPYYHNQPHLQNMKIQKRLIRDNMLTRNGQDKSIYLDAIAKLEQKARGYYKEHIDFESRKFVKMMVLDGCFLIEFLSGFHKNGYSPKHPIFSDSSLWYSISKDMIVLGNQIPLFILRHICYVQSFPLRLFDCFLECYLRFLLNEGQALKHSGRGWIPEQDFGIYESRLHCLQMCRERFVWSVFPRKYLAEEPELSDNIVIPSVTELRGKRVKFKELTNMPSDISFENRVLKLPRLLIDDRSKCLFMNLIAFEHCHLNVDPVVTCYVMFMDNLIKTSKDVDHLKKCGIIKHWLRNDDEVVKLFDAMVVGGKVDAGNYLRDVSVKINKYYVRKWKWNVWLETLKDNYFSNPWSIISLIAATVLLLLTFIQTFFTVYDHFRTNNGKGAK